MKALLPYLAASAGLAALFLAFPGLDRAAAGLFYHPGEGFVLKDHFALMLVYDAIPLLEALLIGLVSVLVVARLVPGLRRFHARSMVIAYIALSFALGPGLITNEFLKNGIGRARPSQVVEFGGTKAFSPPFVQADQCERNCAFVSGHAALAFGMMTFVFLMKPGARRRGAAAAVLAFGTVVGLTRMAQGAHWLSDVIFAALINIAVAWALYEWMIRRDGPARLFHRLRPSGSS